MLGGTKLDGTVELLFRHAVCANAMAPLGEGVAAVGHMADWQAPMKLGLGFRALGFSGLGF